MRLLAVIAFLVVLAIGIAGLLGVLRDDGGTSGRPKDVPRVPTAPREDPAEPAAEPKPAIDASEPRAGPSDERAELSAWNREGIRALDAGEHAAAVASFERCVAARADEPAYAFNLAEALARLALDEYEGGAREAAVAHMERAFVLAPERDDVARLLARWRAILAAEEALWQYETDHFELAFDAQRDDLLYGAQDVLDVLEGAYHEFGLLFGTDPIARGRERVRVVLTQRADFSRATGLGEWAGGAFDGTIRMPLSDLAAEKAAWEIVLRHELVHVFVHDSGKRHVPGWLNEGLAQWLEGDRAALLQGAREEMAGAEPFPLEKLVDSLIRWEDEDEVRRAYAQALLCVDGLARTYGGEVLFQMVAGCARGEEPAVVFEAHTGVPLATAFEDLAF